MTFAEAALALALKAAMLDAWAPTRAVLQSWNNVSWSIPAEMAYYAAFPWLLAAMLRRPLTAIAAAFAVLLAAMAGGQGGLGRALSLRPLVALGEASFAFYMAHMIVMRSLRFWLGADPGIASALALSLAAAFLLHHGLELPMRRRLLDRPQFARPQGYALPAG